jgi:regulator of sigma E protease
MLIGIIAVIIFLSILILVHELGHFLAAKKFGLLVEEFGIGLPPRIWGKKIGETVYSVNALPFGGFVKIFGEDGRSNLENSRNFSFLPIWKRSIIISAGVLMNFLLGWLAISLVFSIGIPQAVLVTDVFPNSPANQIGLNVGDKIIGFSNVEELIKFIDAHRGKEIVLKVERHEEVKEFKTIPRLNPPTGEGALGIGLIEAGLPKKNLSASLWEGFKTSVEMVKNIFLALFDLIAKAFVGKASLEQVAGPVGIVKITAQAGTLGFVYLLQLLALISLNLAVINIFPFPALDGGRLLFLLIEKIKGSPLPAKFERYANAAGMALLLFLMLIITIKDIANFF